MYEGNNEAREELKRADHLIFVTLKYTKTVDVIKNTIHRLINAYDYGIICALEALKKQKKLKQIPLTPLSRAQELKKLTMRRQEMKEFLKFYFLLKRIDKAEYSKKEEYRKNVALTILENDEVFTIDIEKLFEFYKRTRDFIDFVEEKYK
ncbi:MAG TPA: hypothetical protein VJJ21_05200 [Candidatus Nanoarchaeia archaeon]|nr:hypothetical protein [Candidatus Nanoarchaeia archaeon]